jgi:curved DNA-binding protein CbpA
MNYYTILGLDKYASSSEIKAQHKKLSLKYHPDKTINLDEKSKKEANDKWHDINQAYKVLIDIEKRIIYDISGVEGLDDYEKKQRQQDNINEAKERNKKQREERKKRLLQKDLERKLKEEQELREKMELEKKKRERELEEIKKKKEKEILAKQLAAQEREKEAAEKRRKEIEEQNRIRIQLQLAEENRKKEIELKNKRVSLYLKTNSRQLIIPFKNIIDQINHIYITNIDDHIKIEIIDRFLHVVINLDNEKIKKLWQDLKNIKDYFDTEYNDPLNNKSMRGKTLLRKFINISNQYNLDRDFIEKYEEHLKQNSIYDNNDFKFLKNISEPYMELIELITPDIYFI